MIFKKFLFIAFFATLSYGYKILAVFPHPGKSHHIVFDPILVELVKRGNELTVISNFPQKTPLANFTDIPVNEGKPPFIEVLDFALFPTGGGRLFSFGRHLMEAYMLFMLSNESCRNFLDDGEVQKLLNSGQTFDVIILEQFNSDCGYAFAHRFNAPFVGIASHVLMPWSYNRFGVISNPSHVPNHFLGHGSKPTFMQRVDSLLVNTFHKVGYRLKSQRDDWKTIQKTIPDMPPLEEIATKSSLLLINSFTPLTGARQWPPNAIEVGGVHVQKAKPLPADLEKFISDAPHGVVYVSFGSMVKASSMPQDKVDAFLGAFSQLKQRVLWKWENESLPGAPPNLLTKKWMPQIDILSHKNVKAFVSHGGMLGTTEAIHTGVPMLTIPLFGDQFANAASVRESGLGVTLQFEDITKESVLAALNTLLEPKMYANAKRLSEIWHDRPMSPMDTAIYWIEYVARYQGAPHLRSAAVDLPLYQYLLLDVIAFLGAITLTALYVNYQIIKLLLRLCCGSSKSKDLPAKTKTKKTKKEN